MKFFSKGASLGQLILQACWVIHHQLQLPLGIAMLGSNAGEMTYAASRTLSNLLQASLPKSN